MLEPVKQIFLNMLLVDISAVTNMLLVDISAGNKSNECSLMAILQNELYKTNKQPTIYHVSN